MHPLISVAVPTRHRPACITKFVETFAITTNPEGQPTLTIIYDAPERESRPTHQCLLMAALGKVQLNHRFNTQKSGLCKLWNQAILESPTDWIFICNDDIEFKPGWQQYLERKIDEEKHLVVHLFHYGAMLLHKSIVLEIGWFDERFNGGGFEDNDHQLRISEAGLKHKIDRSHDFLRMDGPVEVGHFINHLKHDYHSKNITQGTNWLGLNNDKWILDKWGKRTYDWANPGFRQALEIDHYPAITQSYEEKFGYKSKVVEINNKSIESRRPLFH